MTPSTQALTELIRRAFSLLSDEQLSWDQWALEWQEHNRSKPNLDYTKSVWSLAKGFLDAAEHITKTETEISQYVKRARFRERLANFAVLCLTEKESNYVSDISSLTKELVELQKS